MTKGRKRILFVGEAVTLAHVARPLALARILDPERYDIHFACDDRGVVRDVPFLFNGTSFRRWPLASQSSQTFLKRAEIGRPLYTLETLSRYVEDDLSLIDSVKPDLIIGDFRHSLVVSARLRKVPLATILNAYWSPLFPIREFPVPDFSVVGGLLDQILNPLMKPLVKPIVWWHFAAYRSLYRRFGLPPCREESRGQVLGDVTLYADSPLVVPLEKHPGAHRYIGVPQWSPAVPDPDWWDGLKGKPYIYVSIGSSGRPGLLRKILEGLAPLGLMVALAARQRPDDLPENVKAADFLDGDKLAASARLVVCNGGSGAVYQALLAGTPVLGLTCNYDQLLNMSLIQRLKVGAQVTASELSREAVEAAARPLIADPSYRDAARRLAEALKAWRATEHFPRFVADFFR